MKRTSVVAAVALALWGLFELASTRADIVQLGSPAPATVGYTLNTFSASTMGGLTASHGTTTATLVPAIPGKIIVPLRMEVIKSAGSAYTLTTDPDISPCSPAPTGLWGVKETVGLLDQAGLTFGFRDYSFASAAGVANASTDIGVALKLCVDAGSLSVGSPVTVETWYTVFQGS